MDTAYIHFQLDCPRDTGRAVLSLSGLQVTVKIPVVLPGMTATLNRHHTWVIQIAIEYSATYLEYK